MKKEIASDYIAAAATTSNTIWTEIPINEGTHKVAFTYAEFDVNELIAKTDYVFSGTVIDRKEYEVQWVDENGESWGPFPSSVIEIQISKEYFGELPVDGNTIRVYYPNSLSAIVDGTFQIKDNCEYIFITRALDEQFVQERAEKSPYDRFEQEKYADVYIPNLRDNVIHVAENNVSVYYELFASNTSYISEAITKESVTSDSVLTPDLINGGEFLFFKKNDFEDMLSKLFESRNNLPIETIFDEVSKRQIMTVTEKSDELNTVESTMAIND